MGSIDRSNRLEAERQRNAHEREFTRLMGVYVAARVVYGPESTPANEAFRDAVRYAETHGESIWDFAAMRARLAMRGVR